MAQIIFLIFNTALQSDMLSVQKPQFQYDGMKMQQGQREKEKNKDMGMQSWTPGEAIAPSTAGNITRRQWATFR